MVLLASEGENGKTRARELLALALREAYGMHAVPRVERAAMGKPYFPDHPDIQFNYSHSGPLALCGLAEVPIGVDIENRRAVRPGLARRVLSACEYEEYLRSPAPEEFFLKLWTLKESFWKCTGTGIRAPYGTAEFSFAPDGSVRSNLTDYSFRAYSGPGWHAALCLSGEMSVSPVIQWFSP